MPPVSSASSTRALNAILPLISAGQPYEAHQKARTFASRYQKSGHYDTAIDVLFQSARELLKAGQQGSGTDLAAFLLEVYDTKGEEPNDESRGKCAACNGGGEFQSNDFESQDGLRSSLLLRALRVTGGKRSSTNLLRRYLHLFSSPFTSRSSRWSAKLGPCPSGDPTLHHYVGELLYKGSVFA